MCVVVVTVLVLIAFAAQGRYDNTSQFSNTRPTVSPKVATSEQAQEYLQTIFNGDIQYVDKMGTVKYHSKTIGNLDIISYKYEPNNTVYTSGYEGSEWKVDLKKEVDNFPKIKVGTQPLTTCASAFGCSVQEVTGYNLGSRVWGSIEEYFQPGAAWVKVYYTFDKSTNQIVYVKLIFYSVTKGDAERGVLTAHPEFITTLQQVEQEILTF